MKRFLRIKLAEVYFLTIGQLALALSIWRTLDSAIALAIATPVAFYVSKAVFGCFFPRLPDSAGAWPMMRHCDGFDDWLRHFRLCLRVGDVLAAAARQPAVWDDGRLLYPVGERPHSAHLEQPLVGFPVASGVVILACAAWLSLSQAFRNFMAVPTDNLSGYFGRFINSAEG